MSFLYCKPSVFVVGQEYEILLNLKENGLCFIEVGGETYYEENSGVLPSERTVVKIRIPQSVLDKEKEYSVIFRGTEERKSYYSTFKSLLVETFYFKPLKKTEDIHIYHIADVHYRFEEAKKIASYFGDDTDIFVVNGDIGEVETEKNFLEVCVFVGEISKGEIPVIFVRGNHDTRGRLAELYPKYFPVNGKNTYYTFELGCLNGIVLDCGEDKLDERIEYDSSENTPTKYRGLNRFHLYRQQQLAFLRGLNLETTTKIPFVISHVCPIKTTYQPGGIFDIERELYSQWNEELERIGIKFMICGHFHKAFILTQGDERNLIDHSYPVVVGSACLDDELWGSAVTLNQDKMFVCFTNSEQKIVEKHIILFADHKDC